MNVFWASAAHIVMLEVQCSVFPADVEFNSIIYLAQYDTKFKVQQHKSSDVKIREMGKFEEPWLNLLGCEIHLLRQTIEKGLFIMVKGAPMVW